MADTQEFFGEYLPNKLKDNPDLVQRINAIYVFDIEDTGKWTVDLTDGKGSVNEGDHDDPGCVVSMNEVNFHKLLDNPVSAMMLFMTGKLKVTNTGLAMSLQELLG